jgi:peptidoglycan-N-acetylglucosamine deacetylase
MAASLYNALVDAPFRVDPEALILSVDLEEYYNYVPRADEEIDLEALPKRAAVTLPRLLDLFERCQVKCTFFVLASVLRNVESLIPRILASGHELACHGWSHQRLHQMSPAEFRTDLVRARDTIEAATGVRPLGYRAPAFSVTDSNLWVFDVLRDEGFAYDSSVAPLRNFFYGGLAGAPRFPHRLKNGLVEFPLPIVKLGPLRSLIGGGFYLRVFPSWLNHAFLHRHQARSQSPPVIYVHPWDVDEPKYNVWDCGVSHPSLASQARFMRWTNVVNRGRAFARLERLIAQHRWTSFGEVLA